MDPQVMMAWSLVGLLICNVLTLIGLGIAVMAVLRLIGKIQQESGPAIQKAHDSLAKVETLTQTTEKVVRESVTPALANVQETTHAIRQSAEGVRRTVGRVEDAVAKPIAILAAAGNALDTPAGKAGLLALGMGVARLAFRNHRLQKPMPDNEPVSTISKGKSNGVPT